MFTNPLSPLVTPSWLAENLENPDLKIIDCRFQLDQPTWGYEQYQKSHIPGAYYLDLDRDLSSPVALHGGRHPLPDPDQLAEKLSTIGIHSGKTCVVAYDDSRFAFASRLWWLLRYLGHDKVALLDGGWSGWQRNHCPVSEEIPSSLVGNFIAKPQPDWIVDIETVKANPENSSSVLIDSRERDRYRGEREPIDPIAGHIPGAICLPWLEVTDAQGNCLPPEAQKERWADYANSAEMIVYCGSGVTACVNLFSLAIAGLSPAKLYPGGWSDWCSYLVEI
ncbi:MAG: sulfurtransferase [Snowella sp.]|nr:sulfurtransferase [Snowella sp.]